MSTSSRSRLSRFLSAGAGVLALCGLVAATAAAHLAPPTSPGDPLDPRTYDPASKPFLAVHAAGVQKYTCQANGAWLFTDPEATLYKSERLFFTKRPKPIGTHFLNFATGRPVWQLKDGSSVEAARTASAPAGAGNIPSLLLQAVTTTAGSKGHRLTKTTWVQRLNTAGGVAPDGACAPGDTRAISYSADYFFWKAKARS
jgi:hypothetical protein